jgi:hypothetical protein
MVKKAAAPPPSSQEPQVSQTTSGDTPDSPAPEKSPSVFSLALKAIKDSDDKTLKKVVAGRVGEIIAENGLSEYLTLFLFDDVDSISDYHSDRIYAAASDHRDSGKDVLLLIHSKGGSIEPAYVISKTLKRISSKKFTVAVPRRAKSAATLISLGADEIHMGMASQLGPIDPQFGGLPALAPANALDVIADLACRYPAAADMFTKYLTDQIPIRILGYYQRVSDSAIQYAERLLAGKQLAETQTAESVAKHLVNHYKDHGFVIDLDEARNLLGSGIIREATPEYKAADEVFRFLEIIEIFLDMHGKQHYYVGKVEDGYSVRPTPTPK